MNKLANFPLEKSGLGEAPDETVIVAWPGWSLTVGDIRKARLAVALAEVRAERLPVSPKLACPGNCSKHRLGNAMCGCDGGHCGVDAFRNSQPEGWWQGGA